MRLWSVVASQLQSPVCSLGLAGASTGAVAVVAILQWSAVRTGGPSVGAALLQGLEVGDDVGDLLVVQPAHGDLLLGDRVRLALAEGGHEGAGLHRAGVLEPARHVLGGVGVL